MEDTTRENGCTDIFVYGTLMKGQRNHEGVVYRRTPVRVAAHTDGWPSKRN